MAVEVMEFPYPALFPTSYFPSIALMAAIVQSDSIVIEKQETFPKQTHRNRTVIVTANGPMTLTVPVVRPNGTHTRTSEIQISYAEHWNTIHWRAIETAYNSSPYFLYYRDKVESILNERYDFLLQLNSKILQFLLKTLKLDSTISYTEVFVKPCGESTDYRDRYSYKHPENLPECKPYTQVFCDRIPFNPNVGILDLLFNMGPETIGYLQKI